MYFASLSKNVSEYVRRTKISRQEDTSWKFGYSNADERESQI